jgi:RNA polymerase sporulation-specific sigma factor
MVENLKSREEFIESNLGLVHSICKRFVGRGIEYEDLYQAGCIGLIKATDAFDQTKGFLFSTYAVPVIMGEVRRLFRDGGAVKVSRSIKELYLKITKEKQILEQALNREPTINELAVRLNVSCEEITEALCASQTTVSLTFEGDNGITETDLPTISCEDEISNRLVLDEAFEILNETERKILSYRYYNGLTQSRTAQLLNMSQVQVSRAEKRSLLKLRNFLG